MLTYNASKQRENDVVGPGRIHSQNQFIVFAFGMKYQIFQIPFTSESLEKYYNQHTKKCFTFHNWEYIS
jgi:hypothetical protein